MSLRGRFARDASSTGANATGFDRRVPVLVVKIGPYQYRPSSLGVVRSLGSVGVPVHVIRSGSPPNPDVASRFVAGGHFWSTTGFESPEDLVEGLAERARRIGSKPIVICTDDESAVLVAEHAQELQQWVTTPANSPSLARTLASKRSLVNVARDLGVLTPATTFPRTRADVEDFARHTPFPVIAKNIDPFTRLTRPAVGPSRRIDSPEELLALSESWEEPFEVLLQEYLPRAHAEDWFTHSYSPTSSDRVTVFTGRKIRSWPAYAGITATGVARSNGELSEMTVRLLKELDYRGPADLDWRRDVRDGGYRLLDFNPRLGGQFRIFQDADGTDIARLMHLDLTNRPLPEVEQTNGRMYIDEIFVLPSAISIWKQSAHRSTTEGPSAPSGARFGRVRRPAFAWLALDDPFPLFDLVFVFGRSFVRSRARRQRARLCSYFGRRRDRRAAEPSP